MDLSASVKRWSRHKNVCGEGFMEECEQEPASPALRAAFVKFVDGAYTKWHYHTGEQMLLATEGQGFVEYQDRPVLTIREGARVFIPPGIWHRHGALDKSTLVHLAVTYGDTQWDDEHPCQEPSAYKDRVSLSVESEIAYLNHRLLQAEESGQVADLEPLLAESFFIIRSSGEKADRPAFLEAVPGNANRGRSASDPKVHLVGGCGVFTCVVATTKNPDGTQNAGRFWNTRLFIRENAQWRCAEWQVVRIPEARK